MKTYLENISRIGFNLYFDDNFKFKNELIVLLEELDIVNIKEKQGNYFETISQLILEDKNFIEYINKNEPLLDKTISIPVNIKNATLDQDIPYKTNINNQKEQENELNKDKLILTISNHNLNKENLKIQIKELLIKIKNKSYKNVNENTIFNFFKGYTTNTNTKIQMAESYFYLNEYDKSLSIYSKLKNEKSEYIRRMIGHCNIILNNDVTEPLVIDYLLVLNRVNLIYKISKNLNLNFKIGIEYWLSQQKLSRNRELLIDYLCFRNFKKLNKIEKITYFLEKIKNNIKNRNIKNQELKNLWIPLINLIESEI